MTVTEAMWTKMPVALTKPMSCVYKLPVNHHQKWQEYQRSSRGHQNRKPPSNVIFTIPNRKYRFND